jgi:hypothetical protein
MEYELRDDIDCRHVSTILSLLEGTHHRVDVRTEPEGVDKIVIPTLADLTSMLS